MIIMPSTPRFKTPARSLTSSPSDAITSGVAAVITVSRMASTMCISRCLAPRQTDAIVDKSVARQDEEEQKSLEHATDLVGNTDRQLGSLAAKIGQGQYKAGC